MKNTKCCIDCPLANKENWYIEVKSNGEVNLIKAVLCTITHKVKPWYAGKYCKH